MTAVSVLTADWTPVALTGSLPLTQWRDVTVTQRVAGNDSVQVTLQQLMIGEQTGVQEATRDVLVILDGVTVFRGRIVTAPETMSVDGWTATITAVDYGAWLDRRIVDAETLTYTQVAQADIGWNLIDHVQSLTGGGLGITKGTVTAGSPRDRTYERGKNIREALDQLANVSGGGDWWVTPDRVYRWASPRRGTDTGLFLDLRALGARELAVVDEARARVNAAWVTGGEGTTPVQALAPQPWAEGRIDLMQSYGDVTVQSTLQEKADALVAARGTTTWTFVAPWDTVARFTSPGDLATLIARLPEGYVVQQKARLVERAVKVSSGTGAVDATDRWVAEPGQAARRWARA